MFIKESILKIIEKGETKDNLFFLPPGQLDRKIYLEVNKVLDALGGKWTRKEKAHIFDHDISDAIDDVLLTGEVISKKQEFQFFETPPDIVELLIGLANIEPHHECLEPSAGKGNIAEALRRIVGDSLTCIEILPENVKTLREKNFHAIEKDFLEFSTPYFFDRIVMNPPFTKQQDISHVEKAIKLLNFNGILVSVMSKGVMFRQNKKTLSFWENVKKYSYEIIELPEGSFKISGTMVNTIIIKIRK